MPGTQDETLRIHQANERTMLAWVRTGIAIMTFGFAIARFGVFLRQLAEINPGAAHVPRGIGSTWVGAALVALGMLANLFGTARYASVRRAILRGDLGAPPPAIVYAVGIAATLMGLAMTVLLIRSLGE
jgi:putative membrane protein